MRSDGGSGDWRLDAAEAASRQESTRQATTWTGRCADGTTLPITRAEALRALQFGRAVLVGPCVVRWLQADEKLYPAQQAEIRRIAAERGVSEAAAALIMAALIGQPPVITDPEAISEAQAALWRVDEEGKRERWAHRRLLRRHASELRKAHGLKAADPISAVALPRHARRPPLNGKHWGRRLMGAAICGGFSQQAVKLAGRSRS